MKYHIYQGIGQNGELKKIGDVENQTTYTVEGLTPKTVYRFAVTADNGLRESAKSNIITITTADIPLSSITLSIDKTALEVGGTATATVTVTPADQTSGTPQLVSNNTKVATVNAAGVITAVAPGSAGIQAILGNVKSNLVTVTVYEALVDVTKLTVSDITATSAILSWS